MAADEPGSAVIWADDDCREDGDAFGLPLVVFVDTPGFMP
jgi:hypothetical protein